MLERCRVEARAEKLSGLERKVLSVKVSLNLRKFRVFGLKLMVWGVSV